jgi:hypothetical protein
MFIPRGDIIYESLATSYVLIDALVTDLCEGGFSGTIEVVLRDTDSFIIIAGGNLIAVLEKSGGRASNGVSVQYTRTTVEHLAERSRRERGRVSIYSYTQLTAGAIAGRISAQPLYIGLRTEFTDLEKMISKLSREHDREWFIEINREDGTAALLHMRDAQCGVINSRGATDSGPLDLTGHATLARLVDECTRVGGTVDVYFKLASHPFDGAPESLPFKVADYPQRSDYINREPIGVHTSAPERLDAILPVSDEPPSTVVQERFEQALTEFPIEHSERMETGNNGAAPNPTLLKPEFPDLLAEDELGADLYEQESRPSAGLSLVRDELLPVAADAEDMNEIKRLMGDIARVIEEAAQSVGRPDSFSMSLRAGQLKIADRYPFLDPFAGEFEYLTGEIVFVGKASAAEFVAGFGEALKLAVQDVARSTAYADRFCSYVIEDLNKLLARERVELQRYEIDKVIGEIVS